MSALPRTARSRLLVEWLEGRDVPALIVGLTTANQLVRFDSATPDTLVGGPTVVTGLQNGETLVGIDYRTSNGVLYGVGASATTSTLYTIDPLSGTATPADAAGFVPVVDPAAAGVGVDFNPVADKLRVVTSTGQNLRIDLTGGVSVAAVDTPLVFDNAAVDPNTGAGANRQFFDTNADGDFDPNTNPPVLPAAQVAAVAYTPPAANPFDPAGAKLTTLYGIDTGADALVLIGAADGLNPDGTAGGPASPNAGLVTVATGAGLGADFGPEAGFDIDPVTGQGFAVNGGANSKLYTIDLGSGAATPVGTVGGGLALRGIAVAPAAAGGGSVSLPAATAAFPATRGPLAITVTRTGNIGSAATVDFATAAGTATPGVDFLPASGTLTFNPGEASRQIFLSLPGLPPGAVSPAETFTLTLSNPTGGATLGAVTSTTVTIPAVTAAGDAGTTPAAPANRFFTASGNGQVFVYDARTGAQAFSLTPFAGYTGSLAAAVGDVTGDGTQDIIIGAGPGGAPRIQVVDGSTRGVIADFFAYEETFRGGVYVAAGDVNADGLADVLAGTGNGGGPRARVLSAVGLTSTNQTVLADFFTVESTFRGGVTVAAGDFNNDGRADVVAGTGVGGGARVQVFDGASALLRSGTPTVLANYLAYQDPFRGGVFVAAGDVNGDGITDVVTGVGSGGGPNVITFSGTTSNRLGSFFAYPPTGGDGSAGVRVAVVDPFASGATPIITGGGVGGSSAVRFFDASGASAGTDLSPFPGGFSGGVFVG